MGNQPKCSLSRSFFKSHTRCAPEFLPWALLNLGFPLPQHDNPRFINQTSTQPARRGGNVLCAAGFLTEGQCDALGPHVLPPKGLLPKYHGLCAHHPGLVSRGETGTRAACFPRGVTPVQREGARPGPCRQNCHPTAWRPVKPVGQSHLPASHRGAVGDRD